MARTSHQQTGNRQPVRPGPPGDWAIHYWDLGGLPSRRVNKKGPTVWTISVRPNTELLAGRAVVQEKNSSSICQFRAMS